MVRLLRMFAAEKITARLKDMSKKVPPGAIASMPAIRKAMGIISEPVASPRSPDKDDEEDASPVPEEVSGRGRQPASLLVKISTGPTSLISQFLLKPLTYAFPS